MQRELSEALAALRSRRGFDAARYVRSKTSLLNEYLRRSSIKACVVAVSGGVDSAVTLALVSAAARSPGSPVERVVAALMPLFVERGATHQQTALDRGREVASAFGAQIAVIELAQAHVAAAAAVELGLGVEGNAWAAGQLVSNLRTPALYHVATLLTQHGQTALICGTTNRDEGSFLGFFGKASDGMVDVQLISDLHKSEVYAVARLLGVPASVIEATPTGDTFDGRPDEAMIGAPYDFVELYTGLRCLDERERSRLQHGWSEPARAEFARWAGAVESLHRVNAHKYLGDSPAVHLDVYQRAVPGGWRAASWRPRRSPDHRDFIGEFSLAPALVARLSSAPASPPRASALWPGDSAWLIDGVLDDGECAALIASALAHPAVPVGPHGMTRNFDPAREPVAGFRSAIFDEALAMALWARLAPALPALREMNDHTPTDHDGHSAWRAARLSPLFRVLRYERGGWLVPHHDATYDEGDGVHRTLMSVLIYLTEGSPGDGGATRFLLDPQRHLPLSERQFDDGDEPPPPGDILASILPRRGAALVFDHRLRHDAQAWQGAGCKLLLRADVVFARCGLPAPAPPPAPPALPLEQRLGLRACATRAQVDHAYREALDRGERDPELRAAWKLLRDPYYARVYASLGSLAAAEEAGFFDDLGSSTGDDPREDPRWLVTPLAPLVRRMEDLGIAPGHPDAARDGGAAPLLTVLLTTGSFCPIHAGHLRMMELAREDLERRGAVVLGGYLSPSHDAYVQAKCGDDNPGAAHRVRLCQEAVREAHPWLLVDPWEALHADVALNFTEVMARLERYLSAHLRTPLPVHVVYVAGGDNGRFSLSFLHRGRSVCVPRPGQEARLAPYRAHPRLQGNPRTLFAPADVGSLDASSSQIRRDPASLHLLPGRRAHGLWNHWISRPATARPPLRLLLRDEGDWSLEPWLSARDPAAVRRARAVFFQELQRALHDAFAGAHPADDAGALELRVLSLDAQRASVAAATAGQRVLSLDPCLPGDINLGFSRVIALGDHSDEPYLATRPGWPRWHDAASPPRGPFVLLDDDSSSGGTLAHARQRVARELPDIILTGTHTASDLLPGGALAGLPGQRSDLCDSRDFLVGSREAGFVVDLPTPSPRRARAPYLLPYVSPARRASVPLSREVAFSRAVWLLNADFFAAITPPLLLADAFFAFRDLMAHVGFALDTPLEDVCRWHAERLTPGPSL